MKTLLFAACALLFAGSSLAGGFAFYVNTGGVVCAPRYYAPPACYAPRVGYCPAPVVYNAAPAYYYSAPAIVYAPTVVAPGYRAPIITESAVAPVSFRWRR